MLDKPGVYFWVETITDRTGKVLHEGECGAELERTTVTEIPVTGVDGQAAAIAATLAGVAMIAGAAALWWMRRRVS